MIFTTPLAVASPFGGSVLRYRNARGIPTFYHCVIWLQKVITSLFRATMTISPLEMTERPPVLLSERLLSVSIHAFPASMMVTVAKLSTPLKLRTAFLSPPTPTIFI